MFGFLKKKISGFSEKLKGRAVKKEALPEPVEQIKEIPEQIPPTKTKKPISKPEPLEKPKLVKEKVEEIEEEKDLEHFEIKEESKPKPKVAESTPKSEEVPVEKDKDLAALEELKKDLGGTEVKEDIHEFEEELEEREELKETIFDKEKTSGLEEIADDIETEIPEEAVQEAKAKNRNIDLKSLEEEKRELKAKVGVGGKLKGRLFGGVEIKENEVSDLLWELELSLLESDVEQDTAHELVTKIKERIVGQKIKASNIDKFLNQQIKEILTEMMAKEQIDLLEEIKKSDGPYTILMLGPNGAGKTTHIAKLTKYFMDNGLKVIWAAGDTFRAAAIDQLEVHAERLGVRVVKHQYGADPAAVGFDAVKAAEANKIDVVLIDSAGRQETNKNLMEELKKIEKVVQPKMKIYVGEAYAGQGLLEQAKEFDEAIGINGFILSKIDTDAKGGTTISLLYKMDKPILFVGTGQEYDDLEVFTPEFILNRIL